MTTILLHCATLVAAGMGLATFFVAWEYMESVGRRRDGRRMALLESTERRPLMWYLSL